MAAAALVMVLLGIQSVALNSRVALQGLSMLGLTTVLGGSSLVLLNKAIRF